MKNALIIFGVFGVMLVAGFKGLLMPVLAGLFLGLAIGIRDGNLRTIRLRRTIGHIEESVKETNREIQVLRDTQKEFNNEEFLRVLETDDVPN